ncbi:hypothetical protein D9756_008294 [Leucocoprinus leucothites]|uniref:Cytochrome P450 n=1 Tax=Leucocoprinus leucothites TaxID=201217 RepID=A0A8H5D0J6_9AGAR|nr:hypothetical protein D9756_008294 [Leucoagaricus leucothites]
MELPGIPVALLCYAAIAYPLFFIIYQLWFHPLSRFPGPKLAAITKWYKGYYDLYVGGGLLEHIQELHERYGPVVRIGPNEIHFCSAQAYHQIYAPGSSYPKETFFYKGFGLNGMSFGETDFEAAKIRRDMLAPLFSRRSILKLERVVQDKVDLLVSNLAKYDGKPADLYLAFRCTTLDIISSYSFSYTFNALNSPGFMDPLVTSFEKMVPYFWFTRYFRFLHALLNFTTKWFAALDNAEHEIVYHHLLRPQSEKHRRHPLSRQQLIAEGQVLMHAGSDTAANTLSWGMFYTLRNKEALGKLLRELHEAWPDKDLPMSYTALEKLPYLSAVIKESLRLMGGVVTPLPRVVTSDVHIDDHFVPKGTIVSVGQTFLHQNPAYFPAPHELKPERWLQSDSNTLENYLVPFSRGPRMCPGVNLAWCELYLLFANLFRKLDMEIYETDLSDFRYKEIFAPVLQGRHLHARVRRRDD